MNVYIYTEHMEQVVRDGLRRHAAELERACEQAVEDGIMGVLVDQDGARPHPSVPYGMIHDYPHGRDNSGDDQ